MKAQIRALVLLIAGVLAVPGSAALAQQSPYPDLKGTWTGQVQAVAQGKPEHFPNTGETGPVFREAPWTFVIDRQEGSRFTGMHGRTDGPLRDSVLGMIRADRKTILMVDDDGTFYATLTGSDAMEVCRTEVSADSRGVASRELTRQR